MALTDHGAGFHCMPGVWCAHDLTGRNLLEKNSFYVCVCLSGIFIGFWLSILVLVHRRDGAPGSRHPTRTCTLQGTMNSCFAMRF
jgi:hypothetical protein